MSDNKEHTTVPGTTQTGTQGDDNYEGNEGNDHLETGEGNDHILGAGGDDTLSGGAGNDIVDGGTGDDRILGHDGSGDDDYIGGAGSDTVDYVGSTMPLTVNLSTGSASGSDIGHDTLREIEHVVGGDANDTLVGNAGNNHLEGGHGNDSIDGGSGDDTALYGTALSNYTLTKTGNSYTVVDKSGTNGTDHLTNVEKIQFGDKTVNLTVQAKAAALSSSDLTHLEELYVGFFNRVPDADGLAYWIDQKSAGQSITQIAESFYTAGVQNSSLTGLSAGMSNADFVNAIYRNVLGRSEGADAEGLAHWSGELASGKATHGSLVSSILDSAHTFKGNATWGHVADLLDNKITVAKTFAVDWGLNYNTSNDSITHGMEIAAAVTSTSTTHALELVGVSAAEMHLMG